MISNTLKKRFCKDYDISIGVYDEPYFSDRIRLFKVEDKWELLKYTLENYFNNDEKAFLEYYTTIKEKLMSYIKCSATFVAFNADDMNKYATKNSFRQSNIYNEANVGDRFISIDIRQANFTSLSHYGYINNIPLYLNGDKYNYRDFMSIVNDIEYFTDSKYIRQVIFGNCNPKRQITYEKYLIDCIYNKLKSYGLVHDTDVYSLCSDEIVLKADNITDDAFNKIRNVVINNDFPLTIQLFELWRIRGTGGYIKNILAGKNEGKQEIKCLNLIEAPSAYRYLNGEDFNENDLYFMYENRLARFIDPIHISIDKGEK